jgi:hypothetical protein
MIDDFRNINLLATPAGKLQIIDEAAYFPNPEEVIAKLSELEDFYACAFWVFLNHHECWDGAIFYAAADSKPKRYWRKRINLPRLGRHSTNADGQALSEAIAKTFREKEGRGAHCVVHQYRRGLRGEREYYFAYPQDHRQTAIEYEKGEMTRRPHNPAFEIIFIHNDEEQTLSIWHEGSIDRVKDLQVMFADAVLRKQISRNSPQDNRVYDLDELLDPAFTFNASPELGIAKVELRKLRVRVVGKNDHAVRIDLGTDTPTRVLHERIEAAMRDIPRSMRKVSLVGIRITFELRPGDRQAKTRSFEVAWPNSCSLQNDSYGIVIQRMLVDHGIEAGPPDENQKNGSEGR